MMKSLKNLLDKKIGAKNQAEKFILDDKDIFYIFNRVIKEEFGNMGASKLKPDYFGKKILHIRAESPTWASELWLNKKAIIRKLNKEFGQEIIADIKTK